MQLPILQLGIRSTESAYNSQQRQNLSFCVKNHMWKHRLPFGDTDFAEAKEGKRNCYRSVKTLVFVGYFSCLCYYLWNHLRHQLGEHRLPRCLSLHNSYNWSNCKIERHRLEIPSSKQWVCCDWLLQVRCLVVKQTKVIKLISLILMMKQNSI